MEENVCIGCEKVKDHEIRLREVEKGYMEVKLTLALIDSSQKDIKIMLQELRNSQNDLLTKFVNSTLDIKTNNNQNVWNLAWKIGAVLSPIVTAGATYYFK